MQNLFISIVVALALTASVGAFAAPRMDVGVGTPEPSLITVVPDHEVPNLYYLFPQKFGLAQNESGPYRFLYQEYRSGGFFSPIKAYVTMTFTALYDKGAVEAKVAAIRLQDPAAKFAFITLFDSKITVPDILLPAIENTGCQEAGGVLGQEVACELEVKSNQRGFFLNRFRNGLTHVFQNTYAFTAAVRGELVTLSHTLPMYAGGLTSGEYFLNRHGHPLFPIEAAKPSFIPQTDDGAGASNPTRFLTREEVRRQILGVTGE